ncbi:hypothetical protein D3C71_1414160 [compost metagenome]
MMYPLGSRGKATTAAVLLSAETVTGGATSGAPLPPLDCALLHNAAPASSPDKIVHRIGDLIFITI